MKRIIDGKRYDTEKAVHIHGWDNGNFTNDFRYRSKDLYRTKSGRWFIHHTGGALTDMAKSAGNNSTTGSEDIEPVSAEDAFRFLVSHDGEDEAEELFPEKIQDA